MGWTVIAKGQIEFPIGMEDEIVDQVYAKMENTKHGENGEVYYNLSKYLSKEHGGQITFEMSGNKGIDYEPLDEIKSFILEKLKGKSKIGFIILANEFMESGDNGFYFEYEEEKIESTN